MEKKETYQLSASVNEGILEFVITGEVTMHNVEILRNEIRVIMKTNGADKVLMDLRSLKGSFGFGDAYYRVREYPSDFTRIKFAFVEIPDKLDFQSFYETTTHNVGMRFKWFPDFEGARAWLKSN